MGMRPRWARWAAVAGVAMALGAAPVAARPVRQPRRPPLLVPIRYGDSLWTLARRYGDPERDVREVVATVMRENRVAPGELQPGMVVVIPGSCLRERQ